MARKYERPDFLADRLSRDQYQRWLRRKAAARVRRKAAARVRREPPAPQSQEERS
ncbi:MAG: hypothetical protein NXI21_17170 [Alphaproteobacteria bacterium]|nr:hypothetical protein [Alphaproteobacteria bacterium]